MGYFLATQSPENANYLKNKSKSFVHALIKRFDKYYDYVVS